VRYSYDREKIEPYRYSVYLDNEEIGVDFAPSHQSAVYELKFDREGPTYLVLNTRNGEINWDGTAVSGYQYIDKKTKVYLYAQISSMPEKAGIVTNGAIDFGKTSAEGRTPPWL
jgi:hypothetical protein